MKGPTVKLEQLVRGLRECGVETGTCLIVHSSLSSIGWVDGGAATVVRALLDAIGPDGMLVLPTFIFRYPHPFDLVETPTTMGAIPASSIGMQGFIRSNHPWQSVNVWGRHGEPLIAGHVHCGQCRPGDPIHRLAQMGGKVLLLGVPFNSNTTVHIGECYADLPHRRQSPDGPYSLLRYADGSAVEVNVSGGPDCDAAFTTVEGVMRRRSMIVDGMLGDARTMLMKGDDVIYATVEAVRQAPDSLYCTNPNCASCVKNRALLRSEPPWSAGATGI